MMVAPLATPYVVPAAVEAPEQGVLAHIQRSAQWKAHRVRVGVRVRVVHGSQHSLNGQSFLSSHRGMLRAMCVRPTNKLYIETQCDI